MTGAAALHPMLTGSRRKEGLWIAWPLLAMLLAQGGLFVWMAPRGLDFTDESYYLLSFLHWREFTANVTFFGAYFEAPFRLLGQDVASIRIFGMLLLMSAAGFLAWRAMRFGGVDRADGGGTEPLLPFVLCGMVASLFYYSYGTTLRVPSYNLLVLVCMLVATGLLLFVVDGRASRRQTGVAALGYGLALGACAFTKVTSAAAMVLCHGAFFLAYFQRRRSLELAALALIGVALNVVVLQLLQPRWFDVLRSGVALTITLDGRYATIPFAALWEAILRGAQRLLPALLLAAVVFAVVVRRWGRSSPSARSWLVVALVSGTMLTVQREGYGKSWWALLLFGAALLWLAERLCRDRAPPARAGRSELGLSVLLFALPIAYSIGTNGSLPAHTEMAAVFGVVAMMLPLRRLFALRLIHPVALSIALVALCMPTLVSQLRSLSEPSSTYRLRVGVMDQRSPVRVGPVGDALLVDATTRDDIEALVRSMREAGYRPGEPVLDVTGDGPGLVYVLGGRPVGVAWLIGGYPGSEQAASLVFDSVPADTLRHAWVLSADDNPRALRSWASLLRERTRDAPRVLAATLPYRPQPRWDAMSSRPVTLSLWKPANTSTRLEERSPP